MQKFKKVLKESLEEFSLTLGVGFLCLAFVSLVCFLIYFLYAILSWYILLVPIVVFIMFMLGVAFRFFIE